MTRVVNREVARAWSEGLDAENHTGSFSTDGRRIYSYALCIGVTLSDGTKLVADHRRGGAHGFYSVTTSKHVGLAARHGRLV
jgi:hypothetical protein